MVELRRHFDGTPEAVRDARRFLREAVTECYAEEITADIEVALSELAANAVRHAGTAFDVTITTNGHLRVEVEDGLPAEIPVVRTNSTTALGGRGMQIVTNLCDRWGVHIVRDRKCVWCERDLSSD